MTILRKEGHDEVEHGFALGGLGLGDKDGERDQRVVGEALVSVFGQQRPVLVEEVQEERGTDAFVAVGEGVVLDDEVEQVRGFFFDTGVDLLAIEGLVDRAEAAFEGLVPLAAEQLRLA